MNKRTLLSDVSSHRSYDVVALNCGNFQGIMLKREGVTPGCPHPAIQGQCREHVVYKNYMTAVPSNHASLSSRHPGQTFLDLVTAGTAFWPRRGKGHP